MGSHVLTFSIMMNVLTEHSSCTVIFSVVGLLVSFLLTLPRRLEKLSHISYVSFVSIIGAVVTGMIGVALVKTGSTHTPSFSSKPKVHDACLAVANVIFAYAGHVAFFTLFSELKEIKDFPKALALLQLSEMVLYTVSAIVIYVHVGPAVASPALNSAGESFRKISYTIALPTVCTFLKSVRIELTFDSDCDWGCGKCPCRGQVHICSCFPRDQLDTQSVIHDTSCVGHDLCRALDLVLDHCRGDPSLQRCTRACGVYCLRPSPKCSEY
jgi:hypothetical protein